MNRHYKAAEGNTFIRKADGFDMGEEIWLGVNDSIENYYEREVKRINEYDYE